MYFAILWSNRKRINPVAESTQAKFALRSEDPHLEAFAFLFKYFKIAYMRYIAGSYILKYGRVSDY